MTSALYPVKLPAGFYPFKLDFKLTLTLIEIYFCQLQSILILTMDGQEKTVAKRQHITNPLKKGSSVGLSNLTSISSSDSGTSTSSSYSSSSSSSPLQRGGECSISSPSVSYSDSSLSLPEYSSAWSPGGG
jgi:hypothetical protein